jgi:hypothetical protein
MDFKTRMASVEPLLQAVHFGGPMPGGAKPVGQGAIKEGKIGGGGLSNLIGAASTIAELA